MLNIAQLIRKVLNYRGGIHKVASCVSVEPGAIFEIPCTVEPGVIDIDFNIAATSSLTLCNQTSSGLRAIDAAVWASRYKEYTCCPDKNKRVCARLEVK